jgi:cytochrome b561
MTSFADAVPADVTEQGRYSRVAIWLHWLVALGILANLFIGFTMDSLFAGSRGQVIAIHASIGMSVLALAVLRIFWRVTHRPPEVQRSLPAWERHAASIGHFFLYVAIVALPVSGWAILSTNPPANSAGAAAAKSLGVDAHPNDGIRVWGIVKVPTIGPLNELGSTPEGVRPQSKLHRAFEELHETGSWILIALLLIHLLAALKHQFVDRWPIFARMWFAPSRNIKPQAGS